MNTSVVNMAVSARIQSFWDEMVDFDTASPDDALRHLLLFLCTELHAQNVFWMVAIRMQEALPDDPAQGWRPRVFDHLHPSTRLKNRARGEVRRIDQGQVDITTTRNVSLAGSWRANRLVDLIEPQWFESDFYKTHYLAHDQADTIWCGCPINSDAELYFAVHRTRNQPRFTAEERDRAAIILRQLKWFYRNLLLSYGLGVATELLTDKERTVLKGLLAGQSETDIAGELNRSPHTIHIQVKSIYRKFGISNRATLMSLWLCQTL